MTFWRLQKEKSARRKKLEELRKHHGPKNPVTSEWKGVCPICGAKVTLVCASEDGRNKFYRCSRLHNGKYVVFMVGAE